MMNNKGQVLVVFIILLPLVLLLFSLVVDLGLLYNEKRVVDNNIKSSLTYGLNHLTEDNVKEKVNNLLKENITDIDSLYIDVEENKISVTLVKRHQSIYKVVNFKQNYEIKTTYTGYLNEGKIELIKE